MNDVFRPYNQPFEIRLETWEELLERKHKQEINQRYRKCGVACPQCGEELLIDTMIVLTSYPPKHGYHCEKCDWHGTA